VIFRQRDQLDLCHSNWPTILAGHLHGKDFAEKPRKGLHVRIGNALEIADKPVLALLVLATLLSSLEDGFLEHRRGFVGATLGAALASGRRLPLSSIRLLFSDHCSSPFRVIAQKYSIPPRAIRRPLSRLFVEICSKGA